MPVEKLNNLAQPDKKQSTSQPSLLPGERQREAEEERGHGGRSQKERERMEGLRRRREDMEEQLRTRLATPVSYKQNHKIDALSKSYSSNNDIHMSYMPFQCQ